MAKVRIPAPLQPHAGGLSEVEVPGATLDQVLSALDGRFPGIRGRLCEPDGSLRRFLHVYINDADARALGGPAAPVKPSDEISILPAIAGGSTP